MAATVGTSSVTKNTTGIADNSATAIATVTIPNVTLRGAVRIRLIGSLGAGGAVGANEATGSVEYNIGIAKRAGAAAVVTFSSAYGSAMANLAGAATITVTAAASAIGGGTGVNTFTVNATIARGSGSSANHTCDLVADIYDPAQAGIKVS